MFKVRSHHSWVQRDDHRPDPAGHAISDASQDGKCLLGNLDPLQAHIEPASSLVLLKNLSYIKHRYCFLHGHGKFTMAIGLRVGSVGPQGLSMRQKFLLYACGCGEHGIFHSSLIGRVPPGHTWKMLLWGSQLRPGFAHIGAASNDGSSNRPWKESMVAQLYWGHGFLHWVRWQCRH